VPTGIIDMRNNNSPVLNPQSSYASFFTDMQVFYHACTIKKSAEVIEGHSSRASFSLFWYSFGVCWGLAEMLNAAVRLRLSLSGPRNERVCF